MEIFLRLLYIFIIYYIFKFILFYFLTLQYCIGFAIYQHESTTGIHVFPIPLGHPSAPAPSIQYRALNLDWWLVSYMILYMFQCHSPKSSHPFPLPQNPKDCSIHQCLFCCLVLYFNFYPAAATAAKSFQSCPTLWPHRWQPTRLPVPGILQARTLEWVAIYFSNASKWKVKAKLLSRVWLRYILFFNYIFQNKSKLFFITYQSIARYKACM